MQGEREGGVRGVCVWGGGGSVCVRERDRQTDRQTETENGSNKNERGSVKTQKNAQHEKGKN